MARLYGKANAAMSLWTMGINQSTHGSDGVCAINNLNLITGNVGKPGGTSLSITGQCNAMGTREWSSCSGLPGYRQLENPAHREEVGPVLECRSGVSSRSGAVLFQTDIFPAIETGQIKALWVVATNPMTSMPNTPRIRKTMQNLEFCVVQDAYEDVETANYAHVYLPASRVGGERGLLHQYGASREPHPCRDGAVRRLEAGPLDLHFAGEALAGGARDELAGDARGHRSRK